MRGGRNRQTDHFGFIVPSPHLNGFAKKWFAGFELFHFIGRKRSALKFQTSFGGFGKVGEVARLGGGEVALGVDVKAYAIEDFGGEMTVQPHRANVFVLAIDAVIGDVFAETVEEVSDIVEEGSRDEFFAGSSLLGQIRRLKRVLSFGYLLAEVEATAVVIKEINDLINNRHTLILVQSR